VNDFEAMLTDPEFWQACRHDMTDEEIAECEKVSSYPERALAMMTILEEKGLNTPLQSVLDDNDIIQH